MSKAGDLWDEGREFVEQIRPLKRNAELVGYAFANVDAIARTPEYLQQYEVDVAVTPRELDSAHADVVLFGVDPDNVDAVEDAISLLRDHLQDVLSVEGAPES
ncbi:hypothetical protein [Luteibacter sp.]|uniref:hypothetical protein n=1 Tax=Luteibacter sp. TaxID=1886636 RepID=UPI003F7F5DB6